MQCLAQSWDIENLKKQLQQIRIVQANDKALVTLKQKREEVLPNESQNEKNSEKNSNLNQKLPRHQPELPSKELLHFLDIPTSKDAYAL
jgi:hypothetical protein